MANEEIFNKQEALERKIFRIVLAIATEPSKLSQAKQLLVQFHEQGCLPENFFIWVIEQIDERIMSMALEYTHDAEIMIQILSFKGGTFANLMQNIENLHQQEQISQRVYVKAKLLLRATHDDKQN